MSPFLWAQGLDYYLPDSIEYSPDIPTPKAVIGHEVGEWHVSHDRLIRYMESLANFSDRVNIETYGHTYEGRPLQLLTITSPENLHNIESIRARHLKLSNPDESESLDLSGMPVVVWMGYSVHGNEASGTNASLLAAYYLAAAQGNAIETLLNNTIVLMDPCINPDGMNRFASWVNSHKSKNLDDNRFSLEHNESWPRGRTNHYWFDLNRDWLLVQHPESKGRIAKYHSWKPNVVTDHHEMGTDRTFFFQPGVPSRNHPLTPTNTYTLTAEIAKYHAEALDQIGSLYYSGEGFDDFYFGKGSTYPDINGGIGILFEQASVRGHLTDSENGPIHFPFAIRNQFTTTLSTLKAANGLRNELLTHQREFYAALGGRDDDEKQAYVIQSSDKGRMFHFLDILQRHQIAIYQTSQDISVSGTTFNSEHSYIIPPHQNQKRLIKALFEQRTIFTDSLFYDISAWTLPHAFNIDFEELNGSSFKESLVGEQVPRVSFPVGQLTGGKSEYAYMFSCQDYYSYRSIYRLLKKGLQMKVATETMISETGESILPGTVLLPVAGQSMDSEKLYELMKEVVEQDGIVINALSTGYSSRGKSWGSPTVKPLKKPDILVLADEGINGYEVGEIWHLLDNRFDINMTMASKTKVNSIDLSEFNTIVMASGNYRSLNKKAQQRIKNWIESGGQVICWNTSAKWFSDVRIGNITFEKSPSDTTSVLPYIDRTRYAGAQRIKGAIFEAKLDQSHPLAFGITKDHMPIFKNSELFMKRSNNPFTNPIRYTPEPLLSGYIHSEKLEQLKNSPAVTVSHLGKGRIIAFGDNPNFRAFWFGTNQLFLNAIFFGPLIESQVIK